jgi:Helix-loop-helix DNA-binding domain
MSLGKPDLPGELLFMDQPDQSPYTDVRCINPSLVNLFPGDSSTSSGFPSPEFDSEGMPFSSPPASVSSESENVEQSYGADGLISRRVSIDTWPTAEYQAPKRRASTRLSRRRSASSIAKAKQSNKRVPHNLVEQKYRNTLNSEMERLRCAIPHLSQLCDETGVNAKPSKANILAGAVEYIQSLQMECDRLGRKNVELQRAPKLAFRKGQIPRAGGAH